MHCLALETVSLSEVWTKGYHITWTTDHSLMLSFIQQLTFKQYKTYHRNENALSRTKKEENHTTFTTDVSNWMVKSLLQLMKLDLQDRT